MTDLPDPPAAAEIDLAKVAPCPACGTPVRQFASTPVTGTGLDAQPSGPWHCWPCIRVGRARPHRLSRQAQG